MWRQKKSICSARLPLTWSIDVLPNFAHNFWPGQWPIALPSISFVKRNSFIVRFGLVTISWLCAVQATDSVSFERPPTHGMLCHQRMSVYVYTRNNGAETFVSQWKDVRALFLISLFLTLKMWQKCFDCNELPGAGKSVHYLICGWLVNIYLSRLFCYRKVHLILLCNYGWRPGGISY